MVFWCLERVLVFLVAMKCAVQASSAPSSSSDKDAHSTHDGSVVTGEYCPYDRFNATCRHGEVIQILSARYGRMRIGRCVRSNLGYLGCAVDVRDLVAKRCQARRHCFLDVGDQQLLDTKPCPQDVTWYLEVSYNCIKVLTQDDSDCREDTVSGGGSGRATFVQHPEGGFIASTSARLSSSGGGYGGSHPDGELVPVPGTAGTDAHRVGGGERNLDHDGCARWSLTVPAGQRIRLTLVELLSRNAPGLQQPPPSSHQHQQQQLQQHWFADVCQELGTVTESEQRIPLRACSAHSASGSSVSVRGTDADDQKQLSSTRQPTESPPASVLYTSATNYISVVLSPTIVHDDNYDVIFLIRYEAIGCPNYRTPARSWVQTITTNELVIHCNDSDVTWTVTCQDGRWESSSSQIMSCSGRSKVWHEHLVDANSALPMSILIAVAVGVALGIFLGGILLAVVGSRMNSRRHKYRSNDTASGYAASTLMTSEDDKTFQYSLSGAGTSRTMEPFSSRTLDIHGIRSQHTCCGSSGYSIPEGSSAAGEITCLPPEMANAALDDKSETSTLTAYCRPTPVGIYPSVHRNVASTGTGNFLRHMYETPTVSYSP